MSASLVTLFVLLAAGVVALLFKRRREGARHLTLNGRNDRRAAEERPRAMLPEASSPPPEPADAPGSNEVVHVAELLDHDEVAPPVTHSSTPPIPLLTHRSSSDPSPRSRVPGSKSGLASDAGRYSLSSRSPGDAATAPSDLDGSAIPKAPRVPSEAEPATLNAPAPSPAAPASEPPRASARPPSSDPPQGSAPPPPTSGAPPLSEVPATLSESSPVPSSEPRTQRGLGIPSPPPQRRRPGSGSEWRATTVAGLGSFGGNRGPRPSSSPPSDFPQGDFPQGDAPSSPKAVKGGSTKPVVVQRIRASAKPVLRWEETLRPACDDLARRAARSPRVVLLTAPERAAGWLAEIAVELAAHLARAVPGGLALVETDFERPRLRELFGFEVPFGKGFSEQLHGSVRGQEAAQWFVLDAELGFHLLLEGRIRSPGLLWSQDFPEIVHALGNRYRLVLLVAPSHLTDVDRQALDDVCDDVIVVSSEADARKDDQHLRSGLLADKVIRTIRRPSGDLVR